MADTEPGTVRKLLRQICRRIVFCTRWSTIKDFFSFYFGGLYYRVEEHHAFLAAAGISFSLAICVLPIILLVFSVLGVAFDRPYIAGVVDSFIESAVPYPQLADQVKDWIFARVNEFRLYKNVAGLVGLVGLFLTSTSLFGAMRTILNRVFAIGEGHSILLGKLKDVGLTLLVLAFFLLSILVLPAIDIVGEFAGEAAYLQYRFILLLESGLIYVLSLTIMVLTYAAIFFFVPDKRPPKRAILISAVSAVVLWELARQLFGLYISHVITLKRIYGAYSLLIFIAFWLYYSSLVFVLSAEIGQLSFERATKKRQLALDMEKPSE
jgi:membrane protein